MAQADEVSRSIGFGEAALGQIRRSTIPAYPRNYELWYTYSAGYNHALNRAINSLLRSTGKVNEDEVERIYNTHLSPSRLGDQLEIVSNKITDEVAGILAQINATRAATSDYGKTLAGATRALGDAVEAKDLETLIANLVRATRAAEASNRALDSQLSESRRQISELQESLEAIRFESLTDELTTLSNRKHFDRSIEAAVAQSRESNETFALLLTDIDHFKQFNDQHGHQTGDQVLRLVAMTVKQNVKAQDVACRYGGEEFAVILPRTPVEFARGVAERVRFAVAAKELIKRSSGQVLGHVTVSVGVAAWRRGDTIQSIIERADAALYAAKQAGRDRVCTELDLAGEGRNVA